LSISQLANPRNRGILSHCHPALDMHLAALQLNRRRESGHGVLADGKPCAVRHQGGEMVVALPELHEQEVVVIE
jgi:hypothetical protein